MKTDKQFTSVLSNNMYQRSTIDKMISDPTQVEISNKIKDTLRASLIGDQQSDAHNQFQNSTERRNQIVKCSNITLLDRDRAP